MKIRQLLLPLLTISLLTACKKEDPEKQVLIINPEKLSGYVNQDWSSVAPELSGKKDYLYTELNNMSIKAAISLPAIDTVPPLRHYTLLINVSYTGLVQFAGLTCTDSLDMVAGNQLVLYFYDKAFKSMQSPYYVHASYMEDQSKTISVDELLSKLRENSCTLPILNYRQDTRDFTALYNSAEHFFRADFFGSH